MNTSHLFRQENFEIELILEDEAFWNDKKEERSLESLLLPFMKKAESLFFKECSQSFSLTCYLGRSGKIQELNKEYRNIDRDTDVLSFPLYENREEWPSISQVELGDIYISLDKAWNQGIEFEIGFFAEIIHLLAHGFLHLLGFDHERSERDEKEMEEWEKKLLNSNG